MRFPGVRLVEQTEQKIRRFEFVKKKTKAPIKNGQNKEFAVEKDFVRNGQFLS